MSHSTESLNTRNESINQLQSQECPKPKKNPSCFTFSDKHLINYQYGKKVAEDNITSLAKYVFAVPFHSSTKTSSSSNTVSHSLDIPETADMPLQNSLHYKKIASEENLLDIQNLDDIGDVCDHPEQNDKFTSQELSSLLWSKNTDKSAQDLNGRVFLFNKCKRIPLALISQNKSSTSSEQVRPIACVDPLYTYKKERDEPYKSYIHRELTRENEEEIKKFLKLPSEYVLTNLEIFNLNQGLPLDNFVTLTQYINYIFNSKINSSQQKLKQESEKAKTDSDSVCLFSKQQRDPNDPVSIEDFTYCFGKPPSLPQYIMLKYNRHIYGEAVTWPEVEQFFNYSFKEEEYTRINQAPLESWIQVIEEITGKSLKSFEKDWDQRFISERNYIDLYQYMKRPPSLIEYIAVQYNLPLNSQNIFAESLSQFFDYPLRDDEIDLLLNACDDEWPIVLNTLTGKELTKMEQKWRSRFHLASANMTNIKNVVSSLQNN
ncbi:MAG: hypothetical protein ACOVOR_02170 [Rhabdochlamydiaceae bacterium]